MNERLSDAGLTMQEWALLGLVFDHGQLRLSQIAELLDVESPLATNLVNRLEQKGTVKRHVAPSDGRAKEVRLTPSGLSLVPKLERRLRSELKRYMAGITNAELAIYIGVLEKLAAKGE